MGEETSSQPALGADQASVPIPVPPGPSGLQPDLTLRYDSRQGSGVLGVGYLDRREVSGAVTQPMSRR